MTAESPRQPAQPRAAASPLLAEAGAARPVCSTHRHVKALFPQSSDLFCHRLSVLWSQHEHHTEVNNSAR